MRTVTISEFAASMEEFLRAVQAGETLTLESDEGEVLAKVSPADARDPVESNGREDWVVRFHEELSRLPGRPRTRDATRSVSDVLHLFGKGIVDRETILRVLDEERSDLELLPGR